ncbi:Laminin subunit alpha-2-like protein [Drosera capensis]
MAAVSVSIRPPFPASSCRRSSEVVGSLGILFQLRRVSNVSCVRRNSTSPITSVFENRKSGTEHSETLKPATNILERLFLQAQSMKLEEQLNGHSHLPNDIRLGLNFDTLEFDLQSALEALKKKEEDLEKAEIAVSLELDELARAKEDLERREKEISAARSKQGKLEDELRQSNLTLVSQTREIKDLKLLIDERERKMATAESSLSLKEHELDKMKNELIKKSEDFAKAETDLETKAQLLAEANKVIEKQQSEMLGLQISLVEKEKAFEVALTQQKLEEQKLKDAEAKLEEKTMQWLFAQEEIRVVRNEASRLMEGSNLTLEEFTRVKMLLGDLKSELVSSQKSLAFSRQKMEAQERLLDKQLAEHEEQKQIIMSYMASLEDARLEVDSERLKLRAAEARCYELEQEFLKERKLMEGLKQELGRERSSLQQALKEISALQDELNHKNFESEKLSSLLQVKESELVEARLEIQQLKSEQLSLKLVLEERDLELCTARKKLEEANAEVSELRMLMKHQEGQLMQATDLLKVKDDYVVQVQHELSDVQLKFSAAESVVERIVDLTKKLVPSEGSYGDDVNQEQMQRQWKNLADESGWQLKLLEAELQLTRDYVREKESELIAAHRALTIKDEELKTVHEKLDEKERELKEMKEEMLKEAEDIKQLHSLADKRIHGRSVADLALEKLQLEAAQLEAEAATTALDRIAELSQSLVHKAGSTMKLQLGYHHFDQTELHTRTLVDGSCFRSIETEVARLSALTDQLVQEAGVDK